MTTDYKNLTAFEVMAVAMIVIGVALVAFQVFIALPQETQKKVTASMQVFEMSDAIAEVWDVEQSVDRYVFQGVEGFYQEFYVAASEVTSPLAKNWQQVAHNFSTVANAFIQMSDSLAVNYQTNNYVQPGVEAGMGGRVMGAYFERLVGSGQ